MSEDIFSEYFRCTYTQVSLKSITLNNKLKDLLISNLPNGLLFPIHVVHLQLTKNDYI